MCGRLLKTIDLDTVISIQDLKQILSSLIYKSNYLRFTVEAMPYNGSLELATMGSSVLVAAMGLATWYSLRKEAGNVRNSTSN
jgi:hypothetical protein